MSNDYLIKAAFFDLDGTLIDSAPDLAGTANQMLIKRSLPPIDITQYYPLAGLGPRGMLSLAFHVLPGDEAFAELQEEFFHLYEQRMTNLTEPYPEVPKVLDFLEANDIFLGIITNKLEHFAFPIVGQIFHQYAIPVIIAGDTLAYKKPHAEPSLEAARRLGLMPAQCLMVGDDLRDIETGRKAGMRTVAVTWGYQEKDFNYLALNADHVIDCPSQILDLLT